MQSVSGVIFMQYFVDGKAKVVFRCPQSTDAYQVKLSYGTASQKTKTSFVVTVDGAIPEKVEWEIE